MALPSGGPFAFWPMRSQRFTANSDQGAATAWPGVSRLTSGPVWRMCEIVLEAKVTYVTKAPCMPSWNRRALGRVDEEVRETRSPARLH